MRRMTSSALFLLVFLAFIPVSAAGMKPRAAEFTGGEETYIAANEKTPGYILKKAVEKRIGLAIEVNGSNAAWLRKNLDTIKEAPLLLFVKPKPGEIEKQHIEDLVKITGFNAKIICYPSGCRQSESWKHPLVKSCYSIERGSEGIVMSGMNKNSVGTKASAADETDFAEKPSVSGALLFKETGFFFINLDSDDSEKIKTNVPVIIYSSQSEKKLEELIEKKI